MAQAYRMEKDGRLVYIGEAPDRSEPGVPYWEGFVFTRDGRAFCPKDEPVIDGWMHLPEGTWLVASGIGETYLAHVLIPSGPA